MNANQRLVVEAKNRPCVDCGKRYPYYVMDLDHRPEEVKSFSLGISYSGPKSRKGLVYTEDMVRAEIAKCDAVCKICHARRTMRRLMQERRDDTNPSWDQP